MPFLRLYCKKKLKAIHKNYAKPCGSLASEAIEQKSCSSVCRSNSKMDFVKVTHGIICVNFRCSSSESQRGEVKKKRTENAMLLNYCRIYTVVGIAAAKLSMAQW